MNFHRKSFARRVFQCFIMETEGPYQQFQRYGTNTNDPLLKTQLIESAQFNEEIADKSSIHSNRTRQRQGKRKARRDKPQ